MSNDREEAARLLRCTCPQSWKFHANNCPIQPGEYQENWAREADARIEELGHGLQVALGIIGHPDDEVTQALWRLLSSTHELDRQQEIREIARGIVRDFGKTFDILAKNDGPIEGD